MEKENYEIPWQKLLESITETIPDEVYNNLPQILKEACNQFTDVTDKEVFLLGAIGIYSGCIPNYIGHYDGKWVTPHLYVYVIAPYGSGKGGMTYAYLIGKPIHDAKIQRTKAAMKDYRQAMKEKKKKRDNNSGGEQKVEMPKQEFLFIPANSSKTAIIEALADNNNCGIIFETEGDTLADTLKQDYASYSDVLRKAFHHEPISYLRRLDKEFREVGKPHLSVVISSTPDQLLSLIPTFENGLFSRFLFYLLTPNKIFRNVFAKERENYESYFEDLGKTIENKYNYLSELNKPIFFSLTESQEKKFLQHFGEKKKESIDNLSGTINRLGIICYRLAMIFAMLRIYEFVDAPVDRVICRDVDFDNALQIVMALQKNAEKVYYFLTKEKAEKEREKQKPRLPEDLLRFYLALPDEFTTADGLRIAEFQNIGQRRAERFFMLTDYFINVSHGKYVKTNSTEET